MPIDYQFSGPPGPGIESPSNGLGLGADNFNNVLYLISQQGNLPLAPSVMSKSSAFAQVANISALVTYPVLISGLYLVSAYLVTTVATSGTLPSVTATFTDADSGSVVTQTIVSTLSVSATGTSNSASGTVNAKAGTNIAIATTGYATTTYNIRARIAYFGS